MDKNTRKWGNIGEDYAVGLLERSDYKIIERNFRCKLGEIDIVAVQNNTLIFVEVKTRWSKKFGKPEEAVNFWKLKKIKRVGEYYTLTHHDVPKKQRIDVVAIEVDNGIVGSARIIKVKD